MTQSDILYQTLQTADPEIHALIEREKKRQFQGLEMIASENYTSVAVMEANGSILTNKYSEGLPGARYYGGNEVIDEIEEVCKSRALEAFRLDPSEWGVNVQPYSGSTANFATYTALLKPHDRVMGLDLPSGGHLTHGYQTAKRKVSSTSIYFESMAYQVDKKTGLVDYEQLEESSKRFLPKLVICGASAYPREWDYGRFRRIADGCGAYLMADMAHISGLVATQEAANPFEYCDVVTTTTHKTLRGPRAGLIFFRKKTKEGNATDLETRVNQAVFPGCQGGPHNQTIAAVAVALRQATMPEYKTYIQKVRRNCAVLADLLHASGQKIQTGGTDNHLLLWDLKPHLSGSKFEKLCDIVHITVNKNTVVGDSSAFHPGGVRLGTAALTSRGFGEPEMHEIATLLLELLSTGMSLDACCTQGTASQQLEAFSKVAQSDVRITDIRNRVFSMAERFPMPGA